jgi:hypothetical protein
VRSRPNYFRKTIISMDFMARSDHARLPQLTSQVGENISPSWRAISPRMTGKTAVITGATSGLGRAASLALASLGATLILVGGNKHRGAALVNAIEKQSNGAHAEFLCADISTQTQVRALAERIAATRPCIDDLINNAGARYQCGHLPCVEAKVRRDGSQRGQEAESVGRGKLAAQAPDSRPGRADSHSQRG